MVDKICRTCLYYTEEHNNPPDDCEYAITHGWCPKYYHDCSNTPYCECGK